MSADFTYTSPREDHSVLPVPGPTGLVFNRVSERGNGLSFLNLRGGIDSGNWSVFLYATNLLNERGAVTVAAATNARLDAFGLAYDVHPRPRVVGLGATMRFR